MLGVAIMFFISAAALVLFCVWAVVTEFKGPRR